MDGLSEGPFHMVKALDSFKIWKSLIIERSQRPVTIYRIERQELEQQMSILREVATHWVWMAPIKGLYIGFLWLLGTFLISLTVVMTNGISDTDDDICDNGKVGEQ